jgi:curved DNA-binding protein CbpA
MKNYYHILGVHSNATIQEIKSAFRKLAIRLHPDKNSGDNFFEERFKDIKEAYETLSDVLRKNDYDTKLRYYSGSLNHDAVNKYKELLKRKYKDELRKREEGMGRKYQALEKTLKEETDKRTRQEKAAKIAEESKRKEEEQGMLIELDGHKRLLLQKDQKLKSMKQKLAAAEVEILKAKKNVSLLMAQIDKSKAVDMDGRHSMPVFLNADILKELVKIKDLVSPKDLMTFLKILLKYAETRSLNLKYGREHPHLVQLILRKTISMKPFKLFYTHYNNDPKTIADFKTQLLMYFNIFPI